MKKRIFTLALTLIMCLTLIPATAFAAETTDKISIKVPACNATFTLENVSAEYGIVKENTTEYIFAFPGENGKVTCDTAAVVDLYGEFHGKTPADSNAGGGDPIMKAGWSYSYNFSDEEAEGEGITLVTVFVMADGSLDANYATDYSAKITFVMGYPIEYGYYNTQLPDNLIKAEAELHSILALEVNAANDVPSSWATVEVNAAIAAGLVPENLQKNYAQPVSRGDVAQMFINLIEQSSGQNIDTFLSAKGVFINQNAFSDTNDYAVLAANALGIISGVGDGKFDPNGTFTRAQIAAIINRIARVLDAETEGFYHGFTDVTGHWSNAELGWPVHAGIISGIGGNRFDPDGQLTTEQAIAITYRALQYFQNNNTETAPPASDPDFLSNKICQEVR